MGDLVSTPTVEDLKDSDVFTPEQPSPNGEQLKFIDADIGEFIRRPRTATAREYERKTSSALNTIMRFCAQRTNTVSDAAAIIAYGDDFAAAVGDVADISKPVQRGIDLILSPESPWLALAIAGIPLATQVIRNHQGAIEREIATLKARPDKATRKANRAEAKARRPKLRFKAMGRQFELTVPVNIKVGFLMSQSVEPKALSDSVFSNETVRKALKKRGINVAGYTL